MKRVLHCRLYYSSSGFKLDPICVEWIQRQAAKKPKWAETQQNSSDMAEWLPYKRGQRLVCCCPRGTGLDLTGWSYWKYTSRECFNLLLTQLVACSHINSRRHDTIAFSFSFLYCCVNNEPKHSWNCKESIFKLRGHSFQIGREVQHLSFAGLVLFWDLGVCAVAVVELLSVLHSISAQCQY